MRQGNESWRNVAIRGQDYAIILLMVSKRAFQAWSVGSNPTDGSKMGV